MRTEAEVEARIRRSLRELDRVAVAPIRLAEFQAQVDRGSTRRLGGAVFVAAVAVLTLAVTVGLRWYSQTPGAADRAGTVAPSVAAPAASAPNVLIAGVSGRIYQLGGAATWTIDTCRDQRLAIRGGGGVVAIRVAPDGRNALVLCLARDSVEPRLYMLDLRAQTAAAVPLKVATRGDGLAWDPTGAAFVALVPAACPSGGGGCYALVRIDATSGATRALRSAEAGMRDVRQTSLGLSVFRDDGAERGTYLLTASGWQRLSEHRLVVASSNGEALLVEDRGGGDWVVWLRIDGHETALTDPAHETGYPLAFTPAGDPVVYRVAGSGAIVTYREGKPTHVEPANFCTAAVQSGTALLCAPPGLNAVVSYDLVTRALSSLPAPEALVGGSIAVWP